MNSLTLNNTIMELLLLIFLAGWISESGSSSSKKSYNKARERRNRERRNRERRDHERRERERREHYHYLYGGQP